MKLKSSLFYLFTFLILLILSCSKQKVVSWDEISFTKVIGVSFYGDSSSIRNGKDSDTDYVINSQEEFNDLFETSINYTPNIDFSKHTLLAGTRIVNCIYPKITYEKVYVDVNNKEIKFDANYNFLDGCFTAMGTIYYHVLIPKYESDEYKFTINIELDY